ncbi:helix-turn-helix transcriptional regulator [Chromobacterium subtsugae]|uniref:Helix-turn-helix transcriptional regulator n=1 Tax=Chromobacterium subtsugae TaxID=251747 RepID=A0ABS7FFD0_9NEIS|nr:MULTISPECIES: helix-turn-helix transcriptional regulator [Chromobacterium]KUM02025.1 AraC family transcriptional regulator [Chromobacterium subtsugae]KZE85450.1 AraC family transcriptional regulator [Chromobacterium sp. F49]MBW7567586.1 helix-turn-helix transcriptional regulator [Chromobacterium subtsugae]MBW8288786.1 helix-turn-helix transcriptional regulator [Chromobacterium subtsugae]OBU87075.1 AraC family transcriptional regulator [Chromobacterium subtsugae]
MDSFDHLNQFDRGLEPVRGKPRDYPAGLETPRHNHPTAQLLCAVEGLMLVSAERGQWVVPPTRAIWLPIGAWHQVKMVSDVRMRSIYVREDKLQGLPEACCVLEVTPLLRELVVAAMAVAVPCAAGSRDEKVMDLLLEEIARAKVLPLSLPQPSSAALRQLCDGWLAQPDDARGAAEWARELALDPRTLQRRFRRETGLSFGQWRRQARLMLALQRLACGDSVLKVALDLGYASPSAFATMFKRELGAPPSSFLAVS